MTDPFEDLGAAIRSGTASEVRRILAGHPTLRARLDEPTPGGAFGSTGLQGAVRRGERELIDVLLGAGASIHGRSHWWAGSFGVFDDAGDEGMVEFLLSRGAVMDPHDAAKWGRRDELEKLVAKDPGAVHFRGGDGQTPLHVAASVEIARFLLDHGADIDALDVDHESMPAQYLIKEHQDVARYLVERGCRTDIMLAVALGDLELVRRMLDENPVAIRTMITDEFFPMKNSRAGGTIYNWTLDRYAMLHQVARSFKHNEVLALLEERTPDDLKLVDACETGNAVKVRALVQAQPNLGRALSLPLVRRIVDAAQGSHTLPVRFMLECGWPVDARGQHEATALHWAAFHGNAEMVKMLLKRGASTDIRDADHDGTPLDWARYGETHSWLAKSGDYPAVMEQLERREGSGRIIQ